MTAYAQFKKALMEIRSITQIDKFPMITVVYGPEELFRSQLMSSLSRNWEEKPDSAVQSIEGSQLAVDSAKLLWKQKSLFDPSLLYVTKRCGKQSKIGAFLKDIKSCNEMTCRFVFEFDEAIPADVQKQLNRLSARMFECQTVASKVELTEFIKDEALSKDLKLTHEAIQLIIDCSGFDLASITNEITKLSLAYHGANRSLGSADISPVLGLMKEDHVFELFGYLRSGNQSRARWFIEKMIDRGEKGIAILGMITRHARDLIGKRDRKGPELLRRCAAADLRLKSNASQEILILNVVLDAL